MVSAFNLIAVGLRDYSWKNPWPISCIFLGVPSHSAARQRVKIVADRMVCSLSRRMPSIRLIKSPLKIVGRFPDQVFSRFLSWSRVGFFSIGTGSICRAFSSILIRVDGGEKVAQLCRLVLRRPFAPGCVA